MVDGDLSGRSEGVRREEGKGAWEEEDRVMDSQDQRALKGGRGHKNATNSSCRLKIKWLRHVKLKQIALFLF